MPTYIVRRTKPVLVCVVIEAQTADQAVRYAIGVWQDSVADPLAYDAEEQEIDHVRV